MLLYIYLVLMVSSCETVFLVSRYDLHAKLRTYRLEQATHA